MTKNEIFQTLPLKAQSEISDTLKAYSKVDFYFRGCEFQVRAFTILSATNDGYTHLASFNKDDIFSEEEQIVNYVNSFRSFPIEYNGNKNWKELKKDWKVATMNDESNIVFN